MKITKICILACIATNAFSGVVYFPIRNGPQSEGVPDVYDNIVVWQDDRDHQTNNSDIYGYNLSTQTEFPVSVGSGRVIDPKIYGNTIAWLAQLQGRYYTYMALFACNISNMNPYQITYDDTSVSYFVMSQSNILWSDTSQIFTSDHSGNNKRWIFRGGPNTEIKQYSIAAYGDYVVYIKRDRANTWQDLYGYRISTGQEFPICTAPGEQENPSIWGDVVVWFDFRRGYYNRDIYGYNLSTHTEFFIKASVSEAGWLNIWEDVILWSEKRTNNYDIFCYDLIAGSEIQVTTEPVNQTEQRIYRNLVVWSDNRNGNGSDIYGATITLEPRLVVRRAGPDSVVVNWNRLLAGDGYRLQGSTNLSRGLRGWSDITNASPPFTNSISGGRRMFYRLKK